MPNIMVFIYMYMPLQVYYVHTFHTVECKYACAFVDCYVWLIDDNFFSIIWKYKGDIAQ
jgi:hypothetical protein